jgi:hypothetical protein
MAAVFTMPDKMMTLSIEGGDVLALIVRQVEVCELEAFQVKMSKISFRDSPFSQEARKLLH